MRSDGKQTVKFEITEITMTPHKQFIDKVLWVVPRYRDLFWDAMEMRARRVNQVKVVDKKNNAIIINHEGEQHG